MVGIGALTKQFAKEALTEQVKDVLGAGSSSPETPAPASPPQENIAAMLMGQVQAMQNACKEDQELVVLATVGTTTIRVHELFAPSSKVLVMSGADMSDKALARLISPAEAVQLVCKPVPVAAGKQPTRIRFVTPQPPAKAK